MVVAKFAGPFGRSLAVRFEFSPKLIGGRSRFGAVDNRCGAQREQSNGNDVRDCNLRDLRQNVSLVNLGMGSAVSVLLFLTVVAIAWIFVKGFKTDLSQVRGD